MARLFLVHWNADEAKERATVLRKAGHRVRLEAADGAAAVRAVKASPPDAVVVDLRRVPSHGEAVGVALRSQKATRLVPLLFVEGDAAKTARVKKLLPDAVFSSWRAVRGAVRRAIESALVGAPDGFESTLGALPADVQVRRGARGKADLTLWFARRRRDLDARLPKMTTRAAKGGLWILWPKQASGRGSDLKQPVVRKAGLDAGLVDFKVCSIDATWSGLRFTERRKR